LLHEIIGDGTSCGIVGYMAGLALLYRFVNFLTFSVRMGLMYRLKFTPDEVVVAGSIVLPPEDQESESTPLLAADVE
jgi:hypothetical protein